MTQTSEQKMKLSVVMSTYNEPLKWLEIAINSVLEQTYRDFEMIVICDNPENEELYNYLKKRAKEDERMHLLRNEKNMGLAASLNKGIMCAQGEYIARMDADDCSHPERFAVQMLYLAHHPEIDLVSTSVDFINEAGAIIDQPVGRYYSPQHCRRILPIMNVLKHPTFIFKRKCFIEIGGYRLFETCEDYDFLLRLIDNGANIVQLSRKLVVYRRQSASMSLKKALNTQMNTNYIKKLHHERKKRNVDSFSFFTMKQNSSPSELEKEDYAYILNAFYQLKPTQWMKRSKIVVEGLFHSPYFRKYFPQMAYNKIRCQWVNFLNK